MHTFFAVSNSSPSRASMASSRQSVSVTPKQAIWYASLNIFLSRYWYIGADYRVSGGKKRIVCQRSGRVNFNQMFTVTSPETPISTPAISQHLCSLALTLAWYLFSATSPAEFSSHTFGCHLPSSSLGLHNPNMSPSLGRICPAYPPTLYGKCLLGFLKLHQQVLPGNSPYALRGGV